MPHTITARRIKRHGPNVTRPKAPMTRQLITMAPVIGYWHQDVKTGALVSAGEPVFKDGRKPRKKAKPVTRETYIPVFGEGEIILHPTKGFRALGATTPANELRKELHSACMKIIRARKPVAKVT